MIGQNCLTVGRRGRRVGRYRPVVARCGWMVGQNCPMTGRCGWIVRRYRPMAGRCGRMTARPRPTTGWCGRMAGGMRLFPPSASAQPLSSKPKLPYPLIRGTATEFRDAARARANRFSTLSGMPEAGLSTARQFFELAAAVATAAGVGAEEMAGRLAGVGDDVFQILAGGKTFAALPFADGGHGEAQFGGHRFERFSYLPAPGPEGVGKIPAEVALDTRSFVHAGFHQKPPPVGSRNFYQAAPLRMFTRMPDFFSKQLKPVPAGWPPCSTARPGKLPNAEIGRYKNIRCL